MMYLTLCIDELFHPVCYCGDKLWGGNSNNARVCWLIIFSLCDMQILFYSSLFLMLKGYGKMLVEFGKIHFHFVIVVIFVRLSIPCVVLAGMSAFPNNLFFLHHKLYLFTPMCKLFSLPFLQNRFVHRDMGKVLKIACFLLFHLLLFFFSQL